MLAFTVAAEVSELHQASVDRNKLLHRAVGVINGLQSDTDNLLLAADLHKDTAFETASSSPAPQFRITTGKTSPFKKAKTAVTDQSYEEAALSAAQHRNSLLQRAYSVISNLQVSTACHFVRRTCTQIRWSASKLHLSLANQADVSAWPASVAVALEHISSNQKTTL